MITPTEIKEHYEHEIVIARYTNGNGITKRYSIECNDCYQVLIDCEVN